MNDHILVAGIGSASLGLELVKCLSMSNQYKLFGADISPDAYGHSDPRFVRTTVLPYRSPQDYALALLNFAQEVQADVIAPGAEATGAILSRFREMFTDRGIELMINSREVIELCSDKVRCSLFLAEQGIATPRTIVASNLSDLDSFRRFPCVVKPASDSGGSNLVFLAETSRETGMFVEYLAARGFAACVQEYIDSPDEFTVGVLSARNSFILSSIALKRNLESKLSRSTSYGTRVISSGWSQGRIDHYPEICRQAEKIARALGSIWALNIQGRLKEGVFVPFEINPRHSGTSYARAQAGINEPLIALEFLNKPVSERPAIRLKVGQFHRVLSERFIPEGSR